MIADVLTFKFVLVPAFLDSLGNFCECNRDVRDQDELDIALDMILLVEDELQRDELVGIGRRVATEIGASESLASQA
jgi:low affinity Fe/Cu permease